MSRPDEGLIHAWLDGEVSAEEAARIERLVATDAEWAAAVAEARGLIAASSRIVGALDAVPGGVMPATSPTAVSSAARARSVVRPWMRIAAAVVLVAGTVYVARGDEEAAVSPIAEQTAATAPAAQPPTDQRPADQPTVLAKVPAERERVAARPPALGEEARGAAGAAVAGASAANTEGLTRDRAAESSLAAPAAAPAAPPAPSTERTATREDDLARREAADTSRDLAKAAESAAGARDPGRLRSTRQSAPAPMPTATTAPPSAPMPVVPSASPQTLLDEFSGRGARYLSGCWRATAPDSLAGTYREPQIVQSRGDTLVLLLPTRVIVRVMRNATNGDTLRGEITAQRVSCP